MSDKQVIISNDPIQAGYMKIVFHAPQIAERARPGQFVHVRMLGLNANLLRRPFSIADADPDQKYLSVVYKIVGEGTRYMASLRPGEPCDVMGPLGKGFSAPHPNEIPVVIAGGYGVAALYLRVKRAAQKGILLIGARSEADLLMIDDYRKLGAQVMVTTNDGSVGEKGFVTLPLTRLLAENNPNYRYYACGPQGMLYAVGKQLLQAGIGNGELSLDERMCCGVGACFGCVVKVKADNPDHWRYARSCSEGPVFRADELYYPEGK